jgi:hypothetical protein
LHHFFEQLLSKLLFDESPVELVEPSADALLALVLADEAGFSQLIQQVRPTDRPTNRPTDQLFAPADAPQIEPNRMLPMAFVRRVYYI